VDNQKFEGCLSGENTPYPMDCDFADFDEDGDVDNADSNFFIHCFGQLIPPPGDGPGGYIIVLQDSISLPPKIKKVYELGRDAVASAFEKGQSMYLGIMDSASNQLITTENFVITYSGGVIERTGSWWSGICNYGASLKVTDKEDQKTTSITTQCAQEDKTTVSKEIEQREDWKIERITYNMDSNELDLQSAVIRLSETPEFAISVHFNKPVPALSTYLKFEYRGASGVNAEFGKPAPYTAGALVSIRSAEPPEGFLVGPGGWSIVGVEVNGKELLDRAYSFTVVGVSEPALDAVQETTTEEGDSKLLIASCPAVITEMGVYNIPAEGLTCRGGGIVIETMASLNCQNARIYGGEKGVGITVSGNGAIVTNCNIEGFERGILVAKDSGNVNINNNLINLATGGQYGITVYGPASKLVQNTIVHSAFAGIDIASDGNTIVQNQINSGDFTGIRVTGFRNQIQANTIKNCEKGLIVGGTENIVKDNVYSNNGKDEIFISETTISKRERIFDRTSQFTYMMA
ncbi:MAG: right-handed parallel beta-helix repeat-containing protein, partial [Candidatus Altiarchaeota archaeon]|nr:right-handed parallel beta-helix repeat-containing protein [Candidatus Altiarchaeota archaeon]